MNWQTFLGDNLTTAEDLRSPLKLTDEEYENIWKEIACYPMSVTKYYFSLINPDDPDDPIRKLAIPTGSTILPDGELDTSGEAGNTVLQGMQHKYAETVLILTTADCAMFCRHCFRRRLVGKSNEEIAVDIDAIAEYIRAHPSINNVLLSGGDSFLLPTEEIADWLRKLAVLPQLDFIRFGTRTPVTFPQRILGDYALLELLASYRQQKQLYVVTHFNHPREITPPAMRESPSRCRRDCKKPDGAASRHQRRSGGARRAAAKDHFHRRGAALYLPVPAGEGGEEPIPGAYRPRERHCAEGAGKAERTSGPFPRGLHFISEEGCRIRAGRDVPGLFHRQLQRHAQFQLDPFGPET